MYGGCFCRSYRKECTWHEEAAHPHRRRHAGNAVFAGCDDGRRHLNELVRAPNEVRDLITAVPRLQAESSARHVQLHAYTDGLSLGAWAEYAPMR